MRNLRLPWVNNTVYAWRQHIIDRLTSGILLNIDHRKVELSFRRSVGTRIEIIVVRAPVATHKLKSCETQMRSFFESRHKHTDKTDGREVGNRANHLLIVTQWNLELIPHSLALLAVCERHCRHLFVGDIILSNHQILAAQRDMILIVTLILVERIVLVDVLHIRHTARRLVERILFIVVTKRVSLRAVVTLVAFKYRQALLVVVVTAEIMIVVAGRVVERRELVCLHLGYLFRRQHCAQVLKILLISREFKLLLSRQSVQAHILIAASARSVVKSIRQRCFSRHTSPYSLTSAASTAVGRQSVFIRFVSVFKDVLAHLAEVEVQVAAFVGVTLYRERIHHPELDILYV